jgi:hypothetical protein
MTTDKKINLAKAFAAHNFSLSIRGVFRNALNDSFNKFQVVCTHFQRLQKSAGNDRHAGV